MDPKDQELEKEHDSYVQRKTADDLRNIEKLGEGLLLERWIQKII